MRILHVYKNYHPVIGGIENYTRALCVGLARRGHDVTVLVANSGSRTSREVFEGVEVIRAGSLGTLARAPLSHGIFWEVARLRPDITHLHFPYPVGELAYLLLGRSQCTVVTYHSDIVRQRSLLRVYEPFIWRLLSRADRIIATSPNYIRSSPFLSRFADRCTVIPIGVDVSRFERPDFARVTALRTLYGVPLILFVGLFRYYKGLDYLIEAVHRVAAHLVLVGSGPLEAKLRAKVAAEQLDDRVLFAGAVPDDDLAAYYHACDLFVLPASHRSEALGIAQIEAMACGKPVVSTELGTGTSFVNQHGLTGLVVPPRDARALADAIKRLLADGELRNRLGQAAASRAKTEFSESTMVDRVEALYEELLQEPMG